MGYKLLKVVSVIAISITLTALILKGLLTADAPEAEFLGLQLGAVGAGNAQSLSASVSIINHNPYRGFNVSLSVLQVLLTVVEGGKVYPVWIGARQGLDDTVGMKDTKHFSFESLTSGDYLASYWQKLQSLMKQGEVKINISLYILYQYKIVFWRTRTFHSSFLDLDLGPDFFTRGKFKMQNDYNKTMAVFP